MRYAIKVLTVVLIAFLVLAWLCAALSAAAQSAEASTGCIPPAANWATLVACKTATALPPSSPTAAATRTPEPTFTPVDTPQPLLIRSNGEPFICEESYTWQNGDDWMFVLHCNRVPTFPAPTRIVP